MKPAKIDEAAPKLLKIRVEDADGNVWSETLVAGAKEFSSGSIGYYLGEKVTNPGSGERYQISASFVLVGSKPKKEAGK